jgi:hypothetical protein
MVSSDKQLKELGLCRASFSSSKISLKFAFTLLMAASGCTANSSTIDKAIPKPAVPSSVEQKPTLLDIDVSGAIVELRSTHDYQFQDLNLRLMSVEDSRCAIGETCIWAGQMVVNLEVSNNQDKALELKLVRKRESEVVFALGYSFRLVNVDPHPQKGVAIQFSDQLVEVEIVKTDIE